MPSLKWLVNSECVAIMPVTTREFDAFSTVCDWLAYCIRMRKKERKKE